MVQSIGVVAKIEKDLGYGRGFEDGLEGGAVGDRGRKGSGLEFMDVDDVNAVLRLHEDRDEGDAPMAREAYPFQIDVKGWDVCRKTLNYLDEIHHGQFRVYEAVRGAVCAHVFLTAKGYDFSKIYK
jgi:hypothetical protein